MITREQNSIILVMEGKHFEDNELPIENDNLGILLKGRNLFHGSANPNTEKFMTAEEAETANITDGATVGLGLYLTSSESAAAAYARRRASHSSKKEGLQATSYLTTLDNLKLLDLRSQENLTEFAKKFRIHLVEKLKEENSKHKWWVTNSMINALHEINHKGVTLKNIHNLTGYAMAGVFTDFVKQQGYEGVVTIEGGEGYESDKNTYTGNHDTYVIFDPTKAAIVRKQKI